MSKPLASSVVGIGPTWLDRRQLGLKNPLGTRNHIYKQIYSNILPYGSWDHTLNNTYVSVHGGVFCLEFSPEGSLLVAACEKRSVLMFDPLTHKRIHSVENAHLDSVNCVKFLDSRSFATCSDDYTVALWDARNLAQKVRSLKGHSNWVKNIEYSPQDDLLVTSGFDGSILTWEMNSNNRENGTVYNKVFSTNGLMRTRLTPDATKMVICTTGGYLIVIHNLNLNTLSQDLDGFKPNMYRLMQLSQTVLPIASDFTDLFRGQGKRNRVEFITDFPEGDDAEVVSSLQIHPDGHCAISRNVSNNEKSEWSCIHNIEEKLDSEESDDEGGNVDYEAYVDDDNDADDDNGVKRSIDVDGDGDNDGNAENDDGDDFADDNDDDDSNENHNSYLSKYKCRINRWPENSTSISTTPSYIIQHSVVGNSESRRGNESNSQQHDLSISPSDVWEALVAIQEARIRRESDSAASEISVGRMFGRPISENNPQSGSRSSHFNRQIFIARILPHLGLSGEREEASSHPRNIPPCLRRNMSRNFPESPARQNFSFTPRRCSTSRIIKKNIMLTKQRYTSLYRRSLVGMYDRTSILRKPIYSCGKVLLKYRKPKKNFKLNTRYEINETKRLKNEQLFNSSSGLNKKCLKGPGLLARGKFQMSSPKNDTELKGKSEKVICPIEASSSQSRDCNTLNPFPFEPKNKNNEEPIDNGAGSSEISLNLPNQITKTANDENVIKTEMQNNGENMKITTNRGEASCSSSSPSSSSSSSVSFKSASSSEKTILVGVFRAENRNGLKGTTMRKHNVASVTVSSSTQTKMNSAEENETKENQKNKRFVIDKSRIKSKNKGGGTNSLKGNFSGATNRSRRSGENCSAHDGTGKCVTRSLNRSHSRVPINRKIHQNTKKLTHYVEEPNLGQGFIKELSVSPDSRIICSPFGNGIRLLSFSPNVQDVFHCYPASPPIPLHELALNTAHSDIVVSTKFSPFHNILVSGCLSGKIVYYQPVL